MKAKDFDKKFDDGEDISGCLDNSKATRPGREQKRADTTFRIECSHCNTSLKVKKELAGRKGKCPKCGTKIVIPIPLDESPETSPPIPPATERQKEFASSLGIEFAPDINRREISVLLDRAVQARDDERFDLLQKLDQKEGKHWEEMKQQVIAEMDADDLPLSKAPIGRITEALDDRGLASILIAIPWDDIVDFDDLAGANVQISFGDMMQQEDMEAVVMQIAANIMKRRTS